MMKMQIAVFIFSISVLAHAEKVDYKFCQQTIRKVAADNEVPWIPQKSFSSASLDSFKVENAQVSANSDLKVEFVPKIEDGRLQKVEIYHQIKMCKEKKFGLVNIACEQTVLEFTVDPTSNPCQFEKITFTGKNEEGVVAVRKPIMTKAICSAIRQHRKEFPGEDFNKFEMHYLKGAFFTWRQAFNLTYQPDKLKSGQLDELEKNCQAYSPAADSAAAPATAAGQVPVAPKTQPAAK